MRSLAAYRKDFKSILLAQPKFYFVKQSWKQKKKRTFFFFVINVFFFLFFVHIFLSHGFPSGNNHGHIIYYVTIKRFALACAERMHAEQWQKEKKKYIFITKKSCFFFVINVFFFFFLYIVTLRKTFGKQ